MLTKARLRRRMTFVAAGAAITALTGCLDVNDDPGRVAVLAVVSGSQQNVTVGTAAAQPLIVRAYNNSALGVEGDEIPWTVSAGTVSASRTTTDDTGASQVTYTAPNQSGVAQVRAMANGITVTFNLTIVAASG